MLAQEPHMKRTPDLIHHAIGQMCKATHRGDLHAALRWLILAELQLDVIDGLAGAARHRRVWRCRDQIIAAFEKAAAITAPQGNTKADV
jgi:hypothetical protein